MYTPEQITANAKHMICDGWVYVYGMKGTAVTKAKIDSLRNRYPSFFGAVNYGICISHIGKTGIDCSGFVCKAAGISSLGSSQIHSQAPRKWPVADTSHVRNGMYIWHSGHIGIIEVDDNGSGWILEAQSTAKGLTRTAWSKRASAFTHYGILPHYTMADYENANQLGTDRTASASAPNTPSPAVIGSNTDPSLNIRKSPNGSIIGTFRKGVCVKICATEGNWYQIEHLGSHAYVYASYIDMDSRNEVIYLAYCNDPALNVRQSPNGTKIGVFGFNDVIGVVAEEGNWLRIKYGDSYAYVYKDYVTKENIPVMFWGTVTDSALNIRQKPSSSSTKLGVFSDYPRVRIYGMAGNWYKIRYEDQDAWIYSSYVKKD